MDDRVEYPDAAGYPDGMGYLDEGTAQELAGAGSAEFVTPSENGESEVAIVDYPEEQVYRALVDGRDVGEIHYVRRASAPTVLLSTYVDPHLRGNGIATAFIAHVLDELRGRGESVSVTCPAIVEFLQSHPEYDDVVSPGR